MLARKIGLSAFALLIAIVGLVVTAFSFGLGRTIQNFVMVLAVIVSLMWLWLIWRGKWFVALMVVAVTFMIGVVILPLLSR